MDDRTFTAAEGKPQSIDLTHETDVAYWCRIFDVSAAQLREGVQHAGHQAEDVQRWLREHHVRAE